LYCTLCPPTRLQYSVDTPPPVNPPCVPPGKPDYKNVRIGIISTCIPPCPFRPSIPISKHILIFQSSNTSSTSSTSSTNSNQLHQASSIFACTESACTILCTKWVFQATDTLWPTPARTALRLLISTSQNKNIRTVPSTLSFLLLITLFCARLLLSILHRSCSLGKVPILIARESQSTSTTSCHATETFLSILLRDLRSFLTAMAKSQAFYGPMPFRADGLLSPSTSPQSAVSTPRSASSLAFSIMSFGDDGKLADDKVVVPKVEELDGNDLPLDVKFNIDTIEDAAARMSPEAVVGRRPRGRPRKHPKASPTTLAKPPKGRSKTGCRTCRRRKKKCDETKPICMAPSLGYFCRTELTRYRHMLQKEQRDLRGLSSKRNLAECEA
jgi:hypothetical protein